MDRLHSAPDDVPSYGTPEARSARARYNGRLEAMHADLRPGK